MSITIALTWIATNFSCAVSPACTNISARALKNVSVQSGLGPITKTRSHLENMPLCYRSERRGSILIVRLQIANSKRILYLDTLKAAADKSDAAPLALLIKLHSKTSRNLETLTFDRIEVPAPYVEEVLSLMRKTGRLQESAPPSVKEEVSPKVVVAPLLAPSPLPRLTLTDASGCFANLWIDYGSFSVLFEDFAPNAGSWPRQKKVEVDWEKDLLEAGYLRKAVDNSRYYCPSTKVKEALELLMAVGWKVEHAAGEKVGQEVSIREEKGRILIEGAIRGLLDVSLQMQGVWEGETFVLKKSKVCALSPLLKNGQVTWDASLLRLTEGLQAGAKIDMALPSTHFKGTLLPYQQEGVDWLSFLYQWGFSALLADEMGLGKTVQVLAFLSRIGINLPVLIVAPTSLLFNWRSEISRFLSVCPPVTLISYTELRQNIERYSSTPFEVIILDESNAIKTASTQTAKAAFKLQGRFKIVLTGTPMENRPDELWSQFHFLMPDLVERKIDTLRAQTRPFILRRKKEEVALDLPEKVEQIVWLEMDEPQKELYEAYKQGIKMDGASQMEILEAILRLRQIAVDPRLIGSDVSGSKWSQLMIDIEQAMEEERKILVFSQFTSMLKLIRHEFPKALYLDGSTPADKRGELVTQFQQDPHAALFLLSIKAGGVGLNLTAADYVLLLDPWWNESVERQAIDRAHRIGQKKTVMVKRYLTVGTIEEKILTLKQKKLETADLLLSEGCLNPFELLQLLS